jgi:hypothetical protein
MVYHPIIVSHGLMKAVRLDGIRKCVALIRVILERINEKEGACQENCALGWQGRPRMDNPHVEGLLQKFQHVSHLR